MKHFADIATLLAKTKPTSEHSAYITLAFCFPKKSMLALIRLSSKNKNTSSNVCPVDAFAFLEARAGASHPATLAEGVLALTWTCLQSREGTSASVEHSEKSSQSYPNRCENARI